jgi:N-acetylmuramoyl-L-alanine amidase
VISVDEPDPRIQADAANNFEADVYLGFETTSTGDDRISFYSVPTFESAGGRSLANRVAFELGRLPNFAPMIEGMRLQVLRETKMTAILVSITDVRRTVDLSLEVSLAVRDALEIWTGSPLEA